VREYFLPLNSFIKVGLRPDKEQAPGTPGLLAAKNLRYGVSGLVAPKNIEEFGLQTQWPYPQVFNPMGGSIYATATTLYTGTVDAPTQLITIPEPGHPWSLLDYYPYMLACNGQVKVSRDIDFGLWTINTDAAIPVGRVFGKFNSQAIAGGLTPTWLPESSASWVAWSRPSTMNFVIDELNLAGHRPIVPYLGEVRAIKQLEQLVVCYCAYGVTILTPIAKPAPGFGLLDTTLSGLAHQLSICSNNSVHYYIDITGCLWKVAGGGKSTPLGYAEFFKPLLNSPLVLTLQKSNRGQYEVIISSFDQYFIYNPESKVLTGPCQGSVSGALEDTRLVGAPFTQLQGEVLTDTINFSKTGLKAIQWIEVLGRSIIDLYIAVEYRYENSIVWVSAPWVQANKYGVAHIGIAAAEFRVKMKCSVNSETVISDINVRWKAVDRRFTRGMESAEWAKNQQT